MPVCPSCKRMQPTAEINQRTGKCKDIARCLARSVAKVKTNLKGQPA